MPGLHLREQLVDTASFHCEVGLQWAASLHYPTGPQDLSRLVLDVVDEVDDRPDKRGIYHRVVDEELDDGFPEGLVLEAHPQARPHHGAGKRLTPALAYHLSPPQGPLYG